jgi:hypothetical protein
MKIRLRLNRCVISLIVLTALCAAAQQEVPSEKEHGWRGTWAASAGSRAFHGRWWADLVPKTQNAASGSWTLLSDTNQVILEGTWSARTSPRGWQGTWSARVDSQRRLSGTWESDMTDGKSFADMLKKTLEKQVTGSWRSGRAQGSWWLMGPG